LRKGPGEEVPKTQFSLLGATLKTNKMPKITHFGQKSLLAAPTQNSITYRRHFWTTECKEIEKNTTAFRKSTATLYAKTFGKIAISTPTSVTYFNAR
ncbi:hypothetical protein, partial [Sutterella parvirubra]|uniref:hypothetical protein n=1 Tax=Sutterella parvirubra TaxID=437898 RepID=UPI001C10D79C